MANTLKTQSRGVALWNDRAVIVLQEKEDDVYYYHGLMIGPKGLSIKRALLKLDACYRAAVRKNGDDWDYDDVFNEMVAAGFEMVQAAEWWEANAIRQTKTKA